MQIGAHLPQLGRGATRSALVEFCAEAERLGVHSGWVSDHIAWPTEITSSYPYTDDGSFPPPNDMAWLDPIGTLLFAAACTETMKLGQTVLIMGYRPPIQTAKLIATLDQLSEGRAILGAGVGWMKEEFDVLGMPYDHRGARADEQLEIFRRLFSEPNPSFDGRFYDFPPIAFEPKPVQEKLPVWIGGSTEAAFRRVVRFGDCFHAAFQPQHVVAESWAQIRQLSAEAGRDPAELTLSIRLYLDPAASMRPELSLQGSTAEMADTLGAWEALGVEHVLLDITAPGGPTGRLEALGRFMTGAVG
ncbi:MAG: LLM class F420-dependent oxidoreductase [Actinomycetota bacterium]|jgi:probable F420-dependent oxidoreductase|nr:LLM class F420-dependent oxidoreductase [Actinomycetota bacterium]